MFEGIDLKDVVIVDNAVYSFGFQLMNGVPILPYYEDPNDTELFHLIDFMRMLKDSPDMRDNI